MNYDYLLKQEIVQIRKRLEILDQLIVFLKSQGAITPQNSPNNYEQPEWLKVLKEIKK